jgi:hypothetical protein
MCWPDASAVTQSTREQKAVIQTLENQRSDSESQMPYSRLKDNTGCLERKSFGHPNGETKEKIMSIKLNGLCLGAFLALTPFLARTVLADEWNKKTEFQFSAPVQIPGKVLAAGKYVFQLVDSDSDRDTVQIFSEDPHGRESLVATLNSVPDHISDTPDKPTIHFDERRAGTPEAIHSWFYPGENTGWEFIYPDAETH